MKKIKIYGHRGARGLSPENSLPGYQTALALGVDAIDMDVGMTKDGEIVVTHDYSLNPDITRDAKGEWLQPTNIFIKDLTLKQLRCYDIGRIKPESQYYNLFPAQFPIDKSHIPTLKEVINLVKSHGADNIIFQIEIKTNPELPHYTAAPKDFAEAIAKILREQDILESTEVQAFDYRCLLELQKINPKITTAYLTSDYDKDRPEKISNLWHADYKLADYGHSIPRMIKILGGKIWGAEDTELTPALVAEAHDLGLKVVPWNWPEKAKTEFNLAAVTHLIDMQVDGIITDRPDILKGLLAARNS